MTTSFPTLYVSRVVRLPVSHVGQAFDRLPTRMLLTRTVERDRDDTSVIFASPSEPIRHVIEQSGLREPISVE